MNEFIVWHNNSEQFYYSNDEAYILKEIDGKLFVVEMDNFYNFRNIEEFIIGKAMQYIGKKDINNQKIYADCSIVEFEIILRDADGKVVYKNKNTGYFTYRKDLLRYVIKYTSCEERGIKLYSDHITNLKIIDTIQENKLGLIE